MREPPIAGRPAGAFPLEDVLELACEDLEEDSVSQMVFVVEFPPVRFVRK